jgi:hypothetical protein
MMIRARDYRTHLWRRGFFTSHGRFMPDWIHNALSKKKGAAGIFIKNACCAFNL